MEVNHFNFFFLKASKTLRITSSAPIVIHVLNQDHDAGDSFLVYPTDVLGRLYVAASGASSDTNHKSIVGGAIIEKGTVNISLPSGTFATFSSNTYNGPEIISINLNTYQGFRIEGEDLTGVLLSSDQKFAAFSGHELTTGVTEFPVKTTVDSMFMMLMPSTALPTIYYAYAKPDHEKSTAVRIVSTCATNIMVTRPGKQILNLTFTMAGESRTLELGHNNTFRIDAEHPALVYQISVPGGPLGDVSISYAMSPKC